MNTKKEFTRKEFQEFVDKNDLEVFSKDTIQKAIDDIKLCEDEFEKSCMFADLISLTRVIVVENDLQKSIMFYRPSQVELKKDVENFSTDLQKSGVLVYKNTELNRFKGVVGMIVGSDEIEKARTSAPLGAIRTFNIGGKNVEYMKTASGWKPKGSEQKEEEKQAKHQQTKERAKERSKEREKHNKTIAQIKKERENLVNKYGKSWQSKASTKELKKIKDLVSQMKEGVKKEEPPKKQE